MNVFTIIVIVLTGLFMVYTLVVWLLGLIKHIKARKEFRKELKENSENEK